AQTGAARGRGIAPRTPGPAPPRAVHRARRYAMAQAAAPVGWHKCAVRGAAPARLPAQLRQFWPTPSTYRPRAPLRAGRPVEPCRLRRVGRAGSGPAAYPRRPRAAGTPTDGLRCDLAANSVVPRGATIGPIGICMEALRQN